MSPSDRSSRPAARLPRGAISTSSDVAAYLARAVAGLVRRGGGRPGGRSSRTPCSSPPSTPPGGPTVRTVLAKAIDERGIVFYTNYDSAKGRDLDAPTPAPRPCSPGCRTSGRCGCPAPVEQGRRATRPRRYFATRPRGRSWARGPRRSRRSSPRAPSWSDAEAAGRGALRRRPDPAAAGLGRLPAAPGRGRVLAGPRRPAARPDALPPRDGRRLAPRAARAVTDLERPDRSDDPAAGGRRPSRPGAACGAMLRRQAVDTRPLRDPAPTGAC